jgi:hypothetical protein
VTTPIPDHAHQPLPESGHQNQDGHERAFTEQHWDYPVVGALYRFR